MTPPTLFNRNTSAIALSLLLFISPNTIFAEDDANPVPTNPKSSIKTVVLEDGSSIDISIANSPSTPPGGVMTAKTIPSSPALRTGDVKISGVPAFDWSYGASATAGAMIAGFYDSNGYPDMYTGPTNGGVMPLTNTSWGTGECPLSASKNGLDGRAIRGHVDDYYTDAGDSGPDPYFGNWTAHPSDCTADFMKTNIWFPNSSSEPIFTENINKDGSAVFVLSGDGEPMTADTLETNGYDVYDAGYGLKLFYQSKGETVTVMYNQYINPKKIYGFTFEQYKAEIDANRPVMLHLESHIVVGTGYNESTGNEIIFHDSWDHDEHTMLWGGKYKENVVPGFPGWEHTAVTIVLMTGAAELTWYKDADGDDYSDGTTQMGHLRPSNTYFLASELIATTGDCDDSNRNLNPTTIWYQDNDSDTYGNPDVTLTQCEKPAGYILTNKIDCDDTDPDITTCFNWNLFLPAIINAN
jgi:hypothetical protein